MMDTVTRPTFLSEHVIYFAGLVGAAVHTAEHGCDTFEQACASVIRNVMGNVLLIIVRGEVLNAATEQEGR